MGTYDNAAGYPLSPDEGLDVADLCDAFLKKKGKTYEDLKIDDCHNCPYKDECGLN